MKKKLHITVICYICILFFSLSGCASVTNAKANASFNNNFEQNKLESGVLAENTNFSLNWDSKFNRIFFVEKNTGIIWSNLPDELFETRYDEEGDEITNNPSLEAPFVMEYYDDSLMKSKKANAYTQSAKIDNYSAKKIDNGVEITYYFKRLKISVPVKFVLLDECFSVSVDSSKITENENKVRTITLMPFLCSVKNKENGYLFVPSGGGALIVAKDENEVSKYYSSSVYGDDLQRYPKDRLKTSNTEKIKLPVFGAADTDGKGTLGIISSGAESANIYVDYGNQVFGYSTVAVEFVIRHYQNATANVNSGKWETQVYIDNPINSILSVDYYPLYGDTNNYVSMANIYRKYLTDTYGLSSTNNESLLNINFLGGENIDKNFLGVPYKEMYCTTSVLAAQKITEELSERSSSVKVNLMGYGDAGLQVGKIAGGYSVNKKMGTSKDVRKFFGWAKTNGIDLFMGFDIASFSKSGEGLSTFLSRDVALGVNFRATQQFDYHVGNKAVREDSFSYYLVKRSLVPDIVENVISKAESLDIGGISLDLVANSVYSDYREQQYYGSGNFAKDIDTAIKKIKKHDKNVLVLSANDYAASNANCIYEAPVNSDKSSLFSYDIPFYSIVFKGYVPMTTTSLNLAVDKDLYLHCAETGSGLLYSIANNYNEKLRGTTPDVFYATEFEDQKDIIIKEIEEYEQYFERIKNAKIVDYEVLENGLRKTEFDSRIVVYVNFTDSDINSSYGDIPAKTFRYFEKE